MLLYNVKWDGECIWEAFPLNEQCLNPTCMGKAPSGKKIITQGSATCTKKKVGAALMWIEGAAAVMDYMPVGGEKSLRTTRKMEARNFVPKNRYSVVYI